MQKAQESMFWEIVSGTVFEVHAEHMSADYGREWRFKNDRMETAEGNLDRFPLQSREYALREFWEFWWITDSFIVTLAASKQMFNPKPSSPTP